VGKLRKVNSGGRNFGISEFEKGGKSGNSVCSTQAPFFAKNRLFGKKFSSSLSLFSFSFSSLSLFSFSFSSLFLFPFSFYFSSFLFQSLFSLSLYFYLFLFLLFLSLFQSIPFYSLLFPLYSLSLYILFPVISISLLSSLYSQNYIPVLYFLFLFIFCFPVLLSVSLENFYFPFIFCFFVQSLFLSKYKKVCFFVFNRNYKLYFPIGRRNDYPCPFFPFPCFEFSFFPISVFLKNKFLFKSVF
jgi:hypothetical protein